MIACSCCKMSRLYVGPLARQVRRVFIDSQGAPIEGAPVTTADLIKRCYPGSSPPFDQWRYWCVRRAAARRNSNDCGDNLYSCSFRHDLYCATDGLYSRGAGNLTHSSGLVDQGHNGEVGTMRWTFTIDSDDLVLAIAVLVSALAISLVLV